MEHGTNVNKETNSGLTPFFRACSSGSIDLVEYLVELGVDYNKETDKGLTPLFNACDSDNIDLVKYIVTCRRYK